ncbi:MAG TPA: hypothetical protein VMT58_07570, partial [Candidatus Binataceae bacterium]|nr:hypothetical protein [Candidatus Binataceae bacterium]
MTRFADPDLWGHVRFGQEIIRTGGIVRYDPYSYTAPGHLWRNHEWLAEAIMAAAYDSLGVFGLKLVKLACAAATVTFIAAAEGETGAPVSIQAGVLLVTALMITLQVQFRPQMFTFALFGGLIYLLTRDSYRRRAPLWLAVPLLALWANLHGGFIAGLGALWIYAAVSGVQELIAHRTGARAMRLAAIAAAATIATLATPYGTGTWMAVARALRNPYTRMFVKDWYPLLVAIRINLDRSWLVVSYYCAAIALAAAMIISFIAAPAYDDLALVAIGIAMSAAAFKAMRNISIEAIAIAVPLCRHLFAAVFRWRDSSDSHSAPAMPIPATAIFALLGVALLWQTGLFSGELGGPEIYPAGARD